MEKIGLIISLLTKLIPIVLIVIAIRKWVLQKKGIKGVFIELGIIPIKLSHILVGVLIGALTFTIVFNLFDFFNLMTISNFKWDLSSISSIALLLVIMALLEEILYRSFLINGIKLFTQSNVKILFIAGVFFSLGHITNNGATVLSSLSAFLGGIMYTFAFLKTKNIWLPFGLHFAWNFFQGCVFGFPVSGYIFESLYEIEVTGATSYTGGAYGPEGGLIGILGRLIVIFFILLTTRYLLKTKTDKQ